mgnify:CR=1 FL=1|jgi:ATP-binding cassette subfamily C (CFTR/MRP) protein 1
MLIPFYKPQYAPVGTLEHEVLPHHSANLLSRLFFQYATPVLKVGWSRPLEPEGEICCPPTNPTRTYTQIYGN